MKNTRKLLVSSMIMILSCCLLFAGTTFAWFSDSVTSDNNIITAGNLDVELDYSTTGKVDDWHTVQDASIFTDDTIWEPGHTEAVVLRVKNAGSLAFKYSLKLKVTEEVESVNVEGDRFKLSSYLTVGAKVTEEFEGKAIASRNGAKEIAEKNEIGFASITPFARLLKGEESYVQLVIYMPEEVDNVANHAKGAPKPTIKFGIELVATQLNYEQDSFDENYDKGAAWFGEIDTKWYNAEQSEFTLVSGAELAGLAQLVNGGNTFAGKTIKLGANINLSNTAWTPIGLTGDQIGFAGTFDGQGYIVSNLLIDLTAEPKYQSAGLFGSARNAVIKNFTVKDANVKNLTTGSSTSCGTAVVLGSSQYGSTVENVKVINAEVSGNRYVSAIAGYFKGSINGCSVNKAKLLATPDNFTGEYDNGDKVGAIIGYSNGAVTLTNNAVSDVEIKGYRDLGGIAGAANCGNVSGNTVSNVKLIADQNTNYYGDKAVNTQAVVGRVLGGQIGENKTEEIIINANGLEIHDDLLYLVHDYYKGDTVIVPEGVTTIGGYSFYYNKNVKKAVLSSTVKTLADKAFNESSLTEVVLNEGLEVIGDRAFRRTYSLKSLVIPSTVTTIVENAFQNAAIESLVIPASVKEIGFGGFQGMANLERVVIEGDTYISDYAFRGCPKLHTVILKGEGITFQGTKMVFCNQESGLAPELTVYVTSEQLKDKVLKGDSSSKYYKALVVMSDVKDAKELDEALSAGDSILLPSDFTFSASETNANSGYGATGLTLNGGVLDGVGHTLTVNNANGTWDCAINPKSGTIQNLTVSGAMRGIFMGSATGDVYINNVVFDDVIYTFNSDGGNKEYGVYISNSTLNGWTSFSDVHKEVVFTNCNFGEGSGYAYCRPYNASVFENCRFEEGFEFDSTSAADGAIKFINCYVGDTLVTQENVAELLGSSASKVRVVTLVDDLAELSSALNEGKDVMLTANIQLEEALAIPAGLNVTIDLNGKTITAGNDGYVFENALGSTLTITDSTNSGVINGVVYNEGQGSKMIINGGTFNAIAGERFVLLNSSGYLEINGGTINGGTSYPIYSYDPNSELVINDVTVNATFGCVNVYGLGSKAVINGGTFEMTGVEGKTSHIAYFSNGDVTINGGTFKKIGDISMSGTGGGGICAIYGAKLTITGGTFAGDYADVYDWGGTNSDGRATSIEKIGGTFKH